MRVLRAIQLITYTVTKVIVESRKTKCKLTQMLFPRPPFFPILKLCPESVVYFFFFHILGKNVFYRRKWKISAGHIKYCLHLLFRLTGSYFVCQVFIINTFKEAEVSHTRVLTFNADLFQCTCKKGTYLKS